MPDAVTPHPGLMPKRRTSIPQAPASAAAGIAAAPGRPQFAVDSTTPRRGWPHAVVWPDTSVLLTLHTPPTPPDTAATPDLPGRFRAHYARRTRLAPRIASELRSLSNKSPLVTNHDRALRDAASFAVQRLLIDTPPLLAVTLHSSDGPQVEAVKAQLRALPDASQALGAHSGEAQIIVLAAKAVTAAKAAGIAQTHLLLANDAGASVVALSHGIPTRHSADVIAEMACGDQTLDAETCLRRFKAGNAVSSIPNRVTPRTTTMFTCAGTPAGCSVCD